MPNLANDFDVSIRTLADIRPAAVRLRQAFEMVGPMRIIPCNDIACPAPMRDAEGKILAEEVFGWTDQSDWYKKKGLALEDPVSKACRCESEPFYFIAGRFISRHPNDFLCSIDMSNLDKLLGVSPASGIIIPVHMVMGTIGALGLYVFDVSFDTGSLFKQYADDFFIMAHRFINGYRRVTKRPRQFPASVLSLTKYEVQCLKWVAIGKTDEEIALLINRSTATVRFHINKAAIKMDTSNRSQTVVKATQLGFIG